MNRRRILALTLALCAALALLFSCALMIHEADHDCGGRDCPVCRFLFEVGQSGRRLGAGALFALCAVLFSASAGACVLFDRFVSLARETLVALRVRLNN